MMECAQAVVGTDVWLIVVIVLPPGSSLDPREVEEIAQPPVTSPSSAPADRVD